MLSAGSQRGASTGKKNCTAIIPTVRNGHFLAAIEICFTFASLVKKIKTPQSCLFYKKVVSLHYPKTFYHNRVPVCTSRGLYVFRFWRETLAVRVGATPGATIGVGTGATIHCCNCLIISIRCAGCHQLSPFHRSVRTRTRRARIFATPFGTPTIYRVVVAVHHAIPLGGDMLKEANPLLHG